MNGKLTELTKMLVYETIEILLKMVVAPNVNHIRIVQLKP